MSKEVVNVQMEREFYDKVMNGESAGGGNEIELIYFDANILFDTMDVDMAYAIESIIFNVFPQGSKVSILAEYKINNYDVKQSTPILGMPIDKYIVTNNKRGVAEELMLGSGGLEFLNMDYTKNISLYEFMEMFFDTTGVDGSDIIKRFKSAEVTEEEVMQWLQIPVEE